MKKETLTAISAVVNADPTCSEEQKEQILKACKEFRPEKPRMGTVRQAAKILDCHVKTVQRYAARGILHAVYITRRKVRYDLNEVERLLIQGVQHEASGC